MREEEQSSESATLSHLALGSLLTALFVIFLLIAADVGLIPEVFPVRLLFAIIFHPLLPSQSIQGRIDICLCVLQMSL